MPIKRWVMAKDQPQKVNLLAKEYHISSFLSRVLVGRGLDSPVKAGEFLDLPELSDPFALPDMRLAVDRIRLAMQKKERVAVYGDYDCDGVCSTVMLVRYFRSLGIDTVYYIPEREEGYGMHREAVQKLKDQGVSLIVTVDTGISALEEIEFASSLGMDTVITDHHQAGERLPRAVAVVDAHRKDSNAPFRLFCGAGVVLQLICALSRPQASDMQTVYFPLAAVATVGDVVDLVSENRTIVVKGLESLQSCTLPGLIALLEAAGLSGKKITSESIAFGLVPRLNAAGRMGRVSLAINLLLADSAEQAYPLACALNDLNTSRQEQERKIMAQVSEQLSCNPEKLYQRVLVLVGEGWNQGIVGIASSKILEQFGKPNVLFSVEGEMAVGSARSVGDFSLYDALCYCSSLLTKFGGHKLAAGMQLPAAELPAFEEAVNGYAREFFPEMPALEYRVDSVLFPEELTLENVESLAGLEPFGAGNPAPLFLIENARIQEIVPLSGNRHVKLKLRAGRCWFEALQFGVGTDEFPYFPGQDVDLLVSLDINEFRGKRTVSVKIKDIHPAGFDVEQYLLEKSEYEKFKRGEPVLQQFLRSFLPTREEVAVIYRFLRAHAGFQGDLDMLYIRPQINRLGYGKYRVALDVLEEVGLINCAAADGRIELVPAKQKVSLDSAPIMQKLNAV